MRKLSLVLTGLVLLLSATIASAQSMDRLRLYPPDASRFPTVKTWLDLHDASGAFVGELQPADVTLRENGKTVAIQDLFEIRPPLRVAVAIDETPPMAVNRAQGGTRFEQIADTLRAWAGQTPHDTGDEYSLFSNGNEAFTGLTHPTIWREDFNKLEFNFKTATPSLDSLTAALADLSAASAPEDGTPAGERVLLWITSPPEGKLLAALTDVSDQVRQSGVRLFVWSVSSKGAYGSGGARQLEQLAYDTGGDYFAYSGSEIIPDPDVYLAPFRSLYAVTYTSAASESGEQSLEAEYQAADGPQTSAPVTFSIDLLPPNPVLVSPPTAIRLSGEPGALKPAQQELRALVEFPDGHPRALAVTRLYVDGQVAAENTQEPFDRFTWDLSGLTASGTHHIQIEAVDQLGLSKQSLELPVEVEVPVVQVHWQDSLVQQYRWLPWAAGGTAAAAVCLAVVLGVRKRWKTRRPPKARGRRQTAQPATLAAVPAAPVSPSKAEPTWTERLSWPARKVHPGGAAQLVYLDEDGEPSPRDPLPVSGREILFGREPAHATCMLYDPSVDPLHARLVQDESGAYILSDFGSVAGTWVNYSPVSGEGVALEHGDVLHIGREAFRFLLLKPTTIPHPHVEIYTETL